ncbi:MAG TPA: 16S rRNA (cytosine(1402)-N(4))-methyltransferase RsmH [Candidatus Omnitrophota bacterium]|nr:16S rRNA (cytosine(1402)-N(4))-methyltransferase RsmH [Candidatus Omnitrophota bacterium]HPS36451.1 16S rRNA (cytosine(1402)-N(4))-methyltransferase RsmH [Candidatus Omnitrophota bacterium]
MRHNPVLLQEVLEHLSLRPGALVVDGTLGSGGHSEAILAAIGSNGRLIGFDQDPEALRRCGDLFKGDPRVMLVHENFRNIEKSLMELGIARVDAVLLDVGMSSEQLADEKRGFSFQTKGELDMRMNPEAGQKASELLTEMSENELATLFRDYGEERNAARFARSIVESRNSRPIQTTEDLIQTIENSLPRSLRFQNGRRPSWARHHPATRVFQALRIAVNDELNALRDGMVGALNVLANGGRLAVISFHSLEDRIVKFQFRQWAAESRGKLIFRKPIVAKRSEILNNPRSRSAKLRVIEKIS